MLGANALGVAVCDRRKQQEFAGGQFESLLPDATLAQQHPLAAVQQRVHRGAPLLERGHRCGDRHFAPAIRAITSGRRSGGTVLGGWRRGGSCSSSRVVVSVTSATAASNASALAAEGWVTPLTLRTYWRAAAALSSAVAGGCRPRRSVVFRHIFPTISAARRRRFPADRPAARRPTGRAPDWLR